MELTTGSRRVLPTIVIAQFLCTSVWFAGNAVSPELISAMSLPPSLSSHINSIVQFGFIAGTLLFSIFNIADRFSPSRVFFACSILAAVFNTGLLLFADAAAEVLFFRFMTGFFLAGIYPVGMKIAADHFGKALGNALGLLVGALVLGTALPHLLKDLTSAFPWKLVFFLSSILSLLGGTLMILLVPDGPYRSSAPQFGLVNFRSALKDPSFSKAAFGYFGHMWELYAFWVSVPVILGFHRELNHSSIAVSFWSFMVIAAGAVACAASGWIAGKFGAERSAFGALTVSGTCCLLSPLAFLLPTIPFLVFLMTWGMAVVADSPVFSTLIARHTAPGSRGTVITLVTCIGFSITILSIELLGKLQGTLDQKYLYLVLAIGPIFGVATARRPSKTQLPTLS